MNAAADANVANALHGTAHACLSFIGNMAPAGAGMNFVGGSGPGFYQRDVNQEVGNPDQNTWHVLAAITMPLARIADRLGVQGISAGRSLPPGIWISDGSNNGSAYNYIELIDKMTDRMADYT